MTTSAPTTPDEASPKRSILAYHRTRGLLALACLICFGLFWWVGNVLKIPAALYLDPSLATQDAPVINMLAIAVTLLLCTLIGTLIAGTVRSDAGFFAACVGMMAMAIRFGPGGQVYREAGGTGIFLWLIAETILFYALVAAAWWGQVWLHRKGLAVADTVRDGMSPSPYPLPVRILATITHAAATCLLLLVLLRSNDKSQALISITLASLIASLVAHSLFGVTPSAWMWAGPGIAGVVGYAIGLGNPGAWEIGHPGSPLARAMPLDYAAAGPAGALIGYWISRKWHAARQHDAAAEKTVIAVPQRAARG